MDYKGHFYGYAVEYDFNVLLTGLIFTGYFVGFFIGATVVPKLVTKVGHIRVFAAFASMASLSSLVHVVFVDPYIWIFARFLTGFSMIGIFIIVESWLNDRANNRNSRKSFVSLYVDFIYLSRNRFLFN